MDSIGVLEIVINSDTNEKRDVGGMKGKLGFNKREGDFGCVQEIVGDVHKDLS